jgi:hypothetical protein
MEDLHMSVKGTEMSGLAFHVGISISVWPCRLDAYADDRRAPLTRTASAQTADPDYELSF